MSLRPRVQGNSDAINFRDGVIIGPQVEAMRSEIENMKTHSQLRDVVHEREMSDAHIAAKLDKLETIMNDSRSSSKLEKRLMALEARFESERRAPARIPEIDEAALHRRLDKVEHALNAKMQEVKQAKLDAQLRLDAQMQARLDANMQAREEEAHLHARLDRIEAALAEKRAAQLAAQLPVRETQAKDLALEKLAHLEARMTQLIESKSTAAKPPDAPIGVDAWVNERRRLDSLKSKYNRL